MSELGGEINFDVDISSTQTTPNRHAFRGEHLSTFLHSYIIQVQNNQVREQLTFKSVPGLSIYNHQNLSGPYLLMTSIPIIIQLTEKPYMYRWVLEIFHNFFLTKATIILFPD